MPKPTPAETRHQLTDAYARACVDLKAAESAQAQARNAVDSATLAYGDALSRMLAARRALNHCMYTQAGLVSAIPADAALPAIAPQK